MSNFLRTDKHCCNCSNDGAYIRATPLILGLNGQNTESITLEYGINNPSIDDWIGVFSPANFRYKKFVYCWTNFKMTPP
ncbi:unnamed protein product [Coffea canephora]|uniref:Purple acid phosphatase Fn3-like domain-containing protein n=1 Tax=Coffea canephora TaxID=49390 RepID=A0A068V7T5_COFCA|nr:unnamed protein product [Coffea canephora]